MEAPRSQNATLQMLHYQLKGKRSTGRPLKRWSETVGVILERMTMVVVKMVVVKMVVVVQMQNMQ
jgi:hypothetical protein